MIKFTLRRPEDKQKLDQYLKDGWQIVNQRFLPPDFIEIQYTLAKRQLGYVL